MKKQKDNVQVPQSGQIAVNTKEHFTAETNI